MRMCRFRACLRDQLSHIRFGCLRPLLPLPPSSSRLPPSFSSGGRAGLKGRRLPPLGCLGVLRGERVEKGGKVRGEGGGRDVRFGGVVWRMRRAGRIALFSTRASLRMCLRPRFLLMVLRGGVWCVCFFGVDVLVESRALRVFPAETRLTVYRRRPVRNQ